LVGESGEAHAAVRRRTLVAIISFVWLAVAAAAQTRVHLDGSGGDPRVLAAGTRAIVFLFTSTDCPISNRYAPEVRRLAQRFGPDGVVFRLIYPSPSDSADAIRAPTTRSRSS
jgi:hypothetical protein